MSTRLLYIEICGCIARYCDASSAAVLNPVLALCVRAGGGAAGGGPLPAHSMALRGRHGAAQRPVAAARPHLRCALCAARIFALRFGLNACFVPASREMEGLGGKSALVPPRRMPSPGRMQAEYLSVYQAAGHFFVFILPKFRHPCLTAGEQRGAWGRVVQLQRCAGSWKGRESEPMV